VSEMGGTYSLSLNPMCTNPPFITGSTVCRTGYSEQCGLTAVHCNPARLGGDLNMLFRHEVVHNLQQMNGGCAGVSQLTEWGAEFISNSGYYTFKLDGVPVKTPQVTAVFSQKCSETQLKALALCQDTSLWNLCSQGHSVTW